MNSRVLQDYLIVKEIGEGTFGKVFLAWNKEGRQVAIKRVRKTSWANEEVEILRNLHHPFILEFDGWLEDHECMYLMSEYCGGGCLLDLVSNRTLHESEVKILFRQVVEGVKYLHYREVIHRDLSLSNIFLTGDMSIKIGDFGLAVWTGPGTTHTRFCGNPDYMAPEIVKRHPYGKEVDIWSLGSILFDLLVGYPPFQAETDDGKYLLISKGEFTMPSAISAQAKNLIHALMQMDPSDRLSLDEVLDHPFLCDQVALDKIQVPHDHHMAALHTPLSSLDEWWKADICTVMQEVKNQVPHDHHVTGPNTPNTSLDEWWEGEIDTIIKEVNHQFPTISTTYHGIHLQTPIIGPTRRDTTAPGPEKYEVSSASFPADSVNNDEIIDSLLKSATAELSAVNMNSMQHLVTPPCYGNIQVGAQAKRAECTQGSSMTTCTPKADFIQRPPGFKVEGTLVPSVTKCTPGAEFIPSPGFKHAHGAEYIQGPSVTKCALGAEFNPPPPGFKHAPGAKYILRPFMTKHTPGPEFIQRPPGFKNIPGIECTQEPPLTTSAPGAEFIQRPPGFKVEGTLGLSVTKCALGAEFNVPPPGFKHAPGAKYISGPFVTKYTPGPEFIQRPPGFRNIPGIECTQGHPLTTSAPGAEFIQRPPGFEAEGTLGPSVTKCALGAEFNPPPPGFKHAPGAKYISGPFVTKHTPGPEFIQQPPGFKNTGIECTQGPPLTSSAPGAEFIQRPPGFSVDGTLGQSVTNYTPGAEFIQLPPKFKHNSGAECIPGPFVTKCAPGSEFIQRPPGFKNIPRVGCTQGPFLTTCAPEPLFIQLPPGLNKHAPGAECIQKSSMTKYAPGCKFVKRQPGLKHASGAECVQRPSLTNCAPGAESIQQPPGFKNTLGAECTHRPTESKCCPGFKLALGVESNQGLCVLKNAPETVDTHGSSAFKSVLGAENTQGLPGFNPAPGAEYSQGPADFERAPGSKHIRVKQKQVGVEAEKLQTGAMATLPTISEEPAADWDNIDIKWNPLSMTTIQEDFNHGTSYPGVNNLSEYSQQYFGNLYTPFENHSIWSMNSERQTSSAGSHWGEIENKTDH